MSASITDDSNFMMIIKLKIVLNVCINLTNKLQNVNK